MQSLFVTIVTEGTFIVHFLWAMNNETKINGYRKVIWFSRLLRWALGLIFIGLGFKYYGKENN
jgi:hypothetical protein